MQNSSYMKRSIAHCGLISIATMAGCASSVGEDNIDNAKQALVSPTAEPLPTYAPHSKQAALTMFPIRYLVFTGAMTGALMTGGFDGKSPSVMPGVDPEVRDYNLALPYWSALVTHVANAASSKLTDLSARYIGSSNSYRYRFSSPGSSLIFETNTMDVQGDIRMTAPFSLIAKDGLSVDYVRTTLCSAELKGGVSTWPAERGPNPCSPYRTFATTFMNLIDEGGGGLARATLALSGLSASSTGLNIRYDLFFDPINADEALGPVVITPPATYCALAPRVGTSYYGNAAQPADAHCTRASPEGVPLQNATCGNGYALGSDIFFPVVYSGSETEISGRKCLPP